MTQSFRILLVEDNQDDVELLQIHLNKLDLEFNLDVVDQSNTFKKYLEDRRPDLIISDYNLPGFTGIEALELVRKHYDELPFILVSGYIGEEKAVDAMRKGASDYVLKDNLDRLGPAVKREIIHFREHRKAEEERDKAIHDLRERVKEQKCLYNISSLDQQNLTIPEMLSKAVHFIPGGFQYPEIAEARIEYEGNAYQTGKLSKNGNELSVVSDEVDNGSLSIKVVYTNEKPAFHEGPFLKEEKNLLKSIANNLALKINRVLIHEELLEKQDLLEKAYKLAEIGNWELNIEESSLYWSPTVKEIHEVAQDYEPELDKIYDFYKASYEGDSNLLQKEINAAILEGRTFDEELKICTAKENERWIRVVGEPEFVNGRCVKLFGSIQNIEKRKRAEEELQKSEQRFKSLIQDGTDLISILDAGGYYKYVSPTTQREKSLGMKQDEFNGLRCYDFIHEDDRKRIRNIIENLKPNSRKEIKPYRFKNARGEWRWLESTITNLTETPAVNGYVVNSRDVTDRIKQERKMRDIVEHSTNLFYQHDTNHIITYVSPQAEDFLGCTPEEAKKHWTEFVTNHPANQKGFYKTSRAIETGKVQEPYELQLQKVTGEKIWVEVNEAPIVENGETVAMVGSLTDITERKEYEEQLEELSLVASKTTDVIIITDAKERINWVNKAYEDLTGYTLEESLGRVPGDFLQGPETEPETIKRLAIAIDNKQTIQETILNYAKDGTKYWLDMKIDPIFEDGKCTGFIAIERDVTEKIEQKRKLLESVERYEIVTRATSDTIWDADLQEDTVNYNSNIHDIFGYDENEVGNSGDWWLSKIHPEDRKRVGNHFNAAEQKNKDRVQVEYRFRCADGSYKYINDRAYIINDEAGNPVRMIGAMQDITKQKEENRWLKVLESAIANTNESIAILNAKTKKSPYREILYVNDAFTKMTGFKKEEILGESLLQLMGKETDPRAIVKVLQALDDGEPCHLESAYYSKTGKELWAHISFAPVRDSNNEFSHWICIGRDITERRDKERELRESLQEKETLLMEIHHRVKNNLAVVSSMMQLQAMEEVDESLQRKLYDSVARIRTMVTIHEMLYESGSFSKIDFSENLRKLVTMITETIHNQKKIDVDFNCDEVELNVNQAIPSSLIVNEIVTNSIKHAFKDREKGKITIDLKDEKDQISLKVTDNGNGLPDSFEKLGGSSLGLQLIDVLSKQMEAKYDFNSINGKGTEFSIKFDKKMIKGIGNAYLK